MYRVYGDGICIYNDLCLTGAVNAITPKLNLADNTAGALEITLPVGNAGYEKLERLSSELVVKRDNDEIWAGRIISEKKNFQNSRVLICEGELAYFNDTTQPPTEYDEINVYAFVEALLNEHNSKVAKNKQFEIGSITVNDTISRITNNETTMDAINEHLIYKLGGHVRVRRVYDEDGVLHRYFDYLADYPNTSGQTIRFGQNLLDFTRNWDMSEYATVLMPRGAKLKSSPIESIDAYLDVSSVNGGSRYVTIDSWIWDSFNFEIGIITDDIVKRYGWVELVVDWEEITDPNELLQKAKDYLTANQFADMVIEISAVDLRYLSKDVQPINLLDNVRCISRPHGMDRIFPVTKLSIQLDSPENSTYTLGTPSKKETFTASAKTANTEILEKIAKIPNERTILDKARDNAASIMNMATQGYVTIIKNDKGSEYLTISSENANTAYNPTNDTWKEGTKLWKWSVDGLGYSKDGGKNYELAITMDGGIVANFITTGTMSAERIRTGVLQDEKGNTKWDLTTGVLTMKKGSIALGISSSYPNGRFSVDDYGYLKAEYGKIGGFTIAASSIYNDVLCLDNQGLTFTKVIDGVSSNVGYFGSQYWKLNPTEYGLVMNIDPNYTYVGWFRKETTSADSSTMKLMYTSKNLTTDDGKTFKAGRIHFGCDIDANDRVAYNLWIDSNSGGCNGGISEKIVRIPININRDGTVSRYIEVRIANGMIINAP